MLKLIATLISFVCGSACLVAYDCDRWTLTEHCITDDWPSPFNIELGGGYRQDNFKWSIGGPEDSPDILSELKWKDLRIAQVEGAASYVSCRNYAIAISADYGHIYHGRNIDSDFLRDRREGLFSRSRNKAGKGHVYDLSGGVGYRVTSTCGRFVGTPLVGYSHHAQYLHIYDGHQEVDLFENNTGSFRGLNSRYRAHWFGPWVGMTFAARVETCAYVFGSFDWHFIRYRASGNWNLREDIGPFHHKAHGQGYIITLGGNWEIWSNLSIGIVFAYRNFRTSHGSENIVINTPVRFNAETGFNGAKWRSGSVSGIIAWRF